MFKDIKVEEILVYLMLIVGGYYIAKMFSRSCNGFSVGGQLDCETELLARSIMNEPGCPVGTTINRNKNRNPIPAGSTYDQFCCN